MSLWRFLAVNDPSRARNPRVDVWIPLETLVESRNIFSSGGYRYLVVVGGPTQKSGSESKNPTPNADLAASRPEKLGIDAKKLIKISVPERLARPYARRAMAVKHWLDSSGTFVCCVDVFTVGVHARKSSILFRHALGDSYRVGIIAGSEPRYDPQFWLVSRTGLRIVVVTLEARCTRSSEFCLTGEES